MVVLHAMPSTCVGVRTGETTSQGLGRRRIDGILCRNDTLAPLVCHILAQEALRVTVGVNVGFKQKQWDECW